MAETPGAPGLRVVEETESIGTGIQREDWVYVLPIDAKSDVLCLGENVARMSIRLSEILESVVVAIPRDHGKKFTGYDGCLEARGNLHAVVVEGSSQVGQAPFQSKAFDLVFCTLESDMRRFPTRSLGELRALVRPGGSIALIVRTWQRWTPRADTFWIKALRRAGWGSARSHWVYPNFRKCQWIMPIGDRENVVGCLDLLSRNRPRLQLVGFRLLSALVRRRFPLGRFASTIMLVAARDDAPGHT